MKNRKQKILIIVSGTILLILAIVVGMLIAVSKRSLTSLNQNLNSPPSPLPTNPDNPPPHEEEPSEQEQKCPYLNETITKLPSGNYGDGKAYLTEFKKIPHDFVIKCWKKSYHWLDIVQLWGWKIPETYIPNLKTEKRVGVIRELSVMRDFEKLDRGELDYDNPGGTPYKGVSRNLVVIVRKISNSGSKINLDKSIEEDPMDYDRDENTTRDYYQELVNFTLSREKNINSQQYEVSLLWSLGVENFQKEEEINWGGTTGNSAGSVVYLALISVLHNLPIGKKVCATGTIKMTKEEKVKTLNGQEVILKKGDNIPIGNLKEKAIAAAEAGLNQLILSKYHSSPNILTKPSKKNPVKNITSADYQQAVPEKTRSKLTVHWTENTKDLRKLLFQNKL